MRKFIISGLVICLFLANTAISNDTKKVVLDQDKTELAVKNDSPESLRIFNTISEIDFVELKTKAGVFAKMVVDGYTNNHKPGSPELPVLSKLIEVPYGAEVKLNVVNYNKEILTLSTYGISSQIIPSQPPVSKSFK